MCGMCNGFQNAILHLRKGAFMVSSPFMVDIVVLG